MRRTLLALLLVATATHPAPAQEPAQASRSPHGPPELSIDDLELVRFVPHNVSASELFEAVRPMLGRMFFVTENGGVQSAPVDNIRPMGDGLVIYDEAPSVERILATLGELDASAAPPPEEPLSTWDFRPRYISLSAADDVLDPYQRRVRLRGERVPNYSLVRERSLVSVRETRENLDRIQAALQRVDVPPPEVRLRILLLLGGADPPGPTGLPEDVLADLEALVPGGGFRRIGFALLQTTVASGGRLTARLGTTGVRSYEFSLQPTAYDVEGGTLSAVDCQLLELTAGAEAVRVFSTNLVFRGGEYTVVGASGTDPVFVVVQAEPVR